MKFIKKHIKLLIFVIVCIITFLIYQKFQDNKIVYTSLGDGFAIGINSFGDKSYGYSDYLKDYLKKEDVLKKYNNEFSYQDMMIKDLYKDILFNAHDKNNNNIRQVLRESSLLTISVGINDLIYKMDVNKNLTEYQQKKILTEIVESFDNMIKEIKKYYQNDIYIIGYYNFYPQKSVERNLLYNYNQEIIKYCQKNKLIYVDNTNIEKNLEKYINYSNSFYLNNNGYKQIFDNILEEMPSFT